MSEPSASPVAPPSGRVRPPLMRPHKPRMVAGVCSGIAIHLGLPLRTVRIAFLVATIFIGAGPLLYIWLWVTVPAGDPMTKAERTSPALLARLVPALRDPSRRMPVGDLVAGALVLLILALMLLSLSGVHFGGTWFIPALAVAAGLVLAWSQLEGIDVSDGSRLRGSSLLRLVAGIFLVLLAIIVLVSRNRGTGEIFSSALAGLAMIAGVAVVLAPWWVRLLRRLGDEQAAAARASERADIAAHLHDSVLQTLTVIRNNADNPETVRGLARAQERELREWLYEDRPTANTSVMQGLRAIVAEVEDLSHMEISVVVVGDAQPTPGTQALSKAMREALLNAVNHGKPAFSVYAESSSRGLEVFVRDHGEGFDVDAIAADRHGVKGSIIGRMERGGGSASVRSSAENGTEIRLFLPA